MIKPKPHKSVGSALTSARGALIGLGIFSLFLNLLMLTGPLYMLQVYDRVMTSGSIPTLVALTGLVAGLYVTYAILDWIRQALFANIGSTVEHKLADQVLEASLLARLRAPGAGEPRMLSDLRAVRRLFSTPVLSSVYDVPFSPIFFLALFLLHPYFGLWALFGVAVLTALAVANQWSSAGAAKQAEQMEHAASIQASEMGRNVEVMRVLGMLNPLKARWRMGLDMSDAAMTRSSQTLSGFTSSTKAFRLFLQSAILGIGAWLAINGQSSAGAMIAASILMGRAIAPIEQLVGQWRTIIQTRTSWKNLTKALTEVTEPDEPMPLPPIKGKLDLLEVYAGPPGSKSPTLKKISFSLETGDTLGILGSSAAGKSTLARVIMGVWPTLNGTVRLDGAELSAYSAEMLGPQLGYLPQQVDLFAGTVRENICRFREDASPEDIVAAAQAAACHELILGLSDGYETQIGEGGAYLSAGQRQRIALARALFGNPNFVVMDEPNSNLDNMGEEALQTAIESLKARGATTIIIAHRPSAIRQCNKLLVLNQGETKAFGPRDEVLRAIAASQQATPTVTPLRTGGRSGGSSA